MRYKKHKDAHKILLEISINPSKYYTIHYSCESFYDITDGRTPRITSIAIRNYDTAQTESFSIHKIAEKKHIIILFSYENKVMVISINATTDNRSYIL